MAGIITDFKNDIQKLNDIKKAIADVKNELKGIDIRVRLDIKESIETRLKALSEQYTALVMKIAEAEGKIKLSVHNINKASEAIIQAQEKVSKVTGTTTQQPSATVSPSNTSAETASIQAQAKAYKDLRAEINAVLGTREANIKRMLDEKKAIDLINAEIKKITKSQGDYGNLSSSQQKRLEQLNNSLLTHKAALAEVRQVLSNNVKMDNAAATSINELSQSLSRMRIVYRELTEEERKSPFGKELLSSIQQADEKIKELDATIGNHQRNVGNYGKQWNGLSMSIQQVGRELPSLAYGPKVFFSAISNNLPILADEIKRARTEYDLLKKSGQSATPVWKQIASSLFSWQSALTVGITLLTLYGDKVVDWVSSLFEAKDAMKSVIDIQKQLSEVQLKGAQNAQSEITKLDLLYKATQKTSKSIIEKKRAVDELQKAYPDFFKNFSAEEIIAGKAADAYTRLTAAILASARARAAQDKMTENAKKILENEAKITEEYAKRESKQANLEENRKLLSNLSNTGEAQEFQVGIVNSAQKAVDEIDKRIANLRREIYETNKAQYELSKNINVEDLLFNGNEDSSKATEEERKRRESAAAALLQQQEKYNLLLDKQKVEQIRAEEDRWNQVWQAQIDADNEGSKKALSQMELNHERELQAIDREKEDLLRKKYDEAKALFDADEAIKAQKTSGYKPQSFDGSGIVLSPTESTQFDSKYKSTLDKQAKERQAYYASEKQAMNEYLLKYGTFSQKKEAIDKKYQAAINQETDIGSKNVLQKEWEEALSSLDMDKLKQEINWELIFGDLSKVSKKSLSEVKQQLKTFKSSSEYKDMSVDQKKVIDDALNDIQTTLIDKGGLLGDLPEQLDALRIAQKELNEAQEEYNDAIKHGTDAEKEAALKKKNNAEKNVQNAEVNVTKSADKTSQNLITLADTITGLGSSSEMSLSQIGSLASGLIDAFTDAGSKIGGIVGAAFSLLDVIDKQGIDGFVENVFSSVFKAAGSIWDTITFGAFSKITGSGESDKNLEKDIEYLTQSNQDLKNSLDNLSEKMDKASVTDANDIYKVQKENLEKQEANTLEAMQRSGAAYSNGFWGIAGSHSSNNKIDKGLSTSEWSRISEIVGKSVSNAGQFFQLSSEQMAKLAEEDTTLYSKIKDLANNGYRDAAQYMDEYISYYKQLEELENVYNEKLTNTSFDSIRSDFKNALLDMESDAEDFAGNFEKMMQNAIVESLMTKKYDALIQGWYKEFAKAMEGDSKIDESEQKKLQDRWNSITNQALAERDALKDAMGWEIDKSSSQDSTKRGFGTEMTHEDAGELSGRFAALQISGEETKNQNILQTQSLNLLTMKSEDILRVNSEIKDIADETRDLIANSYLELVQISENTGAIIKPIQQMQKDMAEVKKNTSKL